MKHLKQIRGEGFPQPMGHYADAVLAGRTLYVSGLTAVDESGSLVGGADVGEQSRQVFRMLGAMLKTVGGKPADVVKVTVFMRDISRRVKMNGARQEFFGEHRPASTLVEVSGLVHPEMLVEIEAVAVLES